MICKLNVPKFNLKSTMEKKKKIIKYYIKLQICEGG